MKILNPPLTDAELHALRDRTQQRLEEAMADMGSDYTLHPARRTCPTTAYGREVRDRHQQ